MQSAAKLGYTILSSFVIVLINGIYVKVVRTLANFEKHHDIDSRGKSVSVRSMIGQFNTGLVYLIVNANLNTNKFFSNYESWKDSNSVLKGSYDDFTPEWYAEVGQAITITMLMFAFTPHFLPFFMYVRFHFRIGVAATRLPHRLSQPVLHTTAVSLFDTVCSDISVDADLHDVQHRNAISVRRWVRNSIHVLRRAYCSHGSMASHLNMIHQ